MEILTKLEDYEDWQKLIRHCQFIEELSEFEKEKAKRAFKLLKQEFGEKFLHDAFENNHPICDYIRNIAPWTRKWIIWFAEAIKEVENQENYSSLLDRIKNKEKFFEGFSVLEVAYKFSKSGFNISIDPKTKVSGKTKEPDLSLIDKNTKEEFFVEVTVLGESKVARDASETSKKITGSLWRSIPFMHYCGRVHKTLSKMHLNDIVKKVEGAVDKVKRENLFQELVIDEVLELGIAPKNDKKILEKWAVERALRVGEFTGPPFNVDEVIRIKRKIEREQKQLPHARPSVLIIKNNNVFFSAKDIRRTIGELEEEVYEYPQLLAVVIAGGYMGGWGEENEIIMKDQHVYIKKTKDDMHVEQYIILFNQFCEMKISPSTITKMYNSFRSY